MSLAPKTRVGPYEVVTPLGSGGMGVVYRVIDTKLGRHVALKLLPPEVARAPDRLARFEREAQLLPSLNHPNIAALYGLEEIDDQLALVMELVEGEDLELYLTRGPVPVEETLEIAKQIADAMEEAHLKGVVHRDLKPSNVKLTPEGKVKVLDFGLAKAFVGEGGQGSSSDLSQTPTVAYGQTAAGVVMGTAAYVSPQQARGQTIDGRADTWAFGCVLYEMLTGARAFRGDNVSDILVQVLTREPDWDALPRGLPPALRRLLQRCLAKKAHRRLRDLGDIQLEIDEALDQLHGRPVPDDAPTTQAGATWKRLALWAGVTVVLAGLAFLGGRGSKDATPVGPPAVRAHVDLAAGSAIELGMRPSLALSPDGSVLVLAVDREGISQLYRRLLAEETLVPLDGTVDGTGPFFSPDGRWLGFFAEGKLKKVPTDGGAPIVLADAPVAQGGSFAPDGSVVFAPVHGDGLWRVPADGGAAEPITTVDHARGEAGHHWPHVLPDGKHILMTVELDGKPYSEAQIVLASLETGVQRLLVQGGSDGRYVESGHLVYWHGGDLWIAAFELATLTTNGPPVRVLRNVMLGESNGFAEYGFSRNGVLAYIGGRHPQEERSLVQLDRSGTLETLTPERHAYETLRIAPDGRRLAVTITAANDAVWVYEFARRLLTRVTYDNENLRPIWSPGGDRLLVGARPGGRSYQLRLLAADGGGSFEVVRESDKVEQPESWSPSGDLVAFTRLEQETGSDIWILSMTGDRQARAFLNTRFDEGEARFSPDGRWMAYQSNESGQFEVYLRDFPGANIKKRISTDGGTQPRWRQDGRELFYRRGKAVMAVDVTLGADAALSAPRRLFEGPRGLSIDGLEVSSWDALPDGSGFIMTEDHSEPVTGVNLLLGWLEDVRRTDAFGESSAHSRWMADR
jgi:Tol biopolymer transport system component